MDQQFLINEQDFESHQLIGTLQPQQLDPHIAQIQFMHLRPMLGEAFYYDFLNKVFNTGAAEYADYQDLLNGTTWSHDGDSLEFSGLKPMLVFYTFARMLQNTGINWTLAGPKIKSTDQSEEPDPRRLNARIESAKADAEAYRGQAIHYLDHNRAKYPLYDKSTAPTQRTGVNFFKA